MRGQALPVVALVAAAGVGDELARYLGEAGFAVEPVRAVTAARRARTLVWALDPAPDVRAVIARVRAWLGARADARAVILAARPARLRALVDAGERRVRVLASPLFAWEVVDALRELAALG